MATISDLILAQAEAFIEAAIKARYPELDLRKGTPQWDLLVNPHLPIISEIVGLLNDADRKKTLLSASEMTDTELNARGEFYFVPRNGGDIASGSIRLKFNAPRDVALTTGATATQAGLVYHPVVDVSRADTALAQDPALGFYYVDLVIAAELAGADYDTIVGTSFEIAEFAGDPTFIEAIAVSPIQGGLDDEQPDDYYNRIVDSQTARNLVSDRSTSAMLRSEFKGVIKKVLVIGYQDPEMRRDLMRVVDATLNETISFHRGGHTDVYVHTPIVRQAVELEVPEDLHIDLSAYRAILKIHSVSLKDDPTTQPFYQLVDTDVLTRYSATDPARLMVDPAAAGQTVVVDISYAPDVVAIHEFVNGPDQRVSNADMLVRHFYPAWVSMNAYVEGAAGKETGILKAIGSYLDQLTGEESLVISRVTDAMHEEAIVGVHQDYEVSVQLYFGDGEEIEIASGVALDLPNRPDKGFSPRLAVFVAEGVVVTPLS